MFSITSMTEMFVILIAGVAIGAAVVNAIQLKKEGKEITLPNLLDEITDDFLEGLDTINEIKKAELAGGSDAVEAVIVKLLAAYISATPLLGTKQKQFIISVLPEVIDFMVDELIKRGVLKSDDKKTEGVNAAGQPGLYVTDTENYKLTVSGQTVEGVIAQPTPATTPANAEETK